MELKDKIREIITTVYRAGHNDSLSGTSTRSDMSGIKAVATDRVMELFDEERHLTSAMHSDGEVCAVQVGQTLKDMQKM